MTNQGFLSIILHAHLPYVRHPEYKSFFEENWLFEAITECYIPLINVLERIKKDGITYQLTLSLSPTLISMLSDDLLKMRYQNHLHKQIELAEKEIIRTRRQPHFQKLARLYRRFFISIQKTYHQYHFDLLAAFKQHYESGHLTLITTAATHGFLPLLNISQAAVRNQVEVGIETFKSNLGFAPKGFWLPECGYYPGLEEILATLGIQYFFTDAHGLLDASEKPENGIYAPMACANGVLAFARDTTSSQQVWNAKKGYPSHINYREYYSDIGHELELEYISPYLLDGQDRINTGIKYQKITGNGKKKQPYEPKKAQLKVIQDAEDFVLKCQQTMVSLNTTMERPPIIVAPYDAELFGHWWFEGPYWLEAVLRLVSKKNNPLETISCADYLTRQSSHQVATPAYSSWGEGGYASYWISKENDWLYPFLHKAAEEMEQLAVDFTDITISPLQERAINQANRSLLLAQASDWPFMMKTGTATEYAKKRLTDYLARFNYLHECIRNNCINEHYLRALETMDNIFSEIDFRQYKSVPVFSPT